MDLLGLFGLGRYAGSNSPNGLVRNDDFGPVRLGNFELDCVELRRAKRRAKRGAFLMEQEQIERAKKS